MLGRRARLLSAFLLVVASGALLAWLACGALVARLVGHVASEALGTRVTVARVSLGVFPARVSLGDLTVANPPGYGDEPLLAIERLTVEVAPLALLRANVRVPDVSVDGFALRIEREGGRTNLVALRDRVRAIAAGQPSSARRIVIAQLNVRGGRVTAPALFGRTIALPVRGFTLRDVGQESGGLAPAELVDFLLRLMDPSLRNAVRAF